MTYVEPVETAELQELAARYGPVDLEHIQMEIDEDLYHNRFAKAADRRGEVVFALELPAGILVHRKSFYEDGVFRLPSGGINYGEKVLEALRREIWEETGLTASGERLLGVQDCLLTLGTDSVRFVSYIFHLRVDGEPRLDPEENIVAVRLVAPTALKDIAANLRRLSPPYEGWGRWRALAHDLVYRRLAGQKTGK